MNNIYRFAVSANRKRFANVHVDVLSVEDNANASKGDRSPEEWRPSRRAYWFNYSKKWINIKHRWDLTAAYAEERAVRNMLST